MGIFGSGLGQVIRGLEFLVVHISVVYTNSLDVQNS